MRHWLALTALITGCLISTPSSAQFYDGNDLKRTCDRGSDFCNGYIIGAVDDLVMQQQVDGAKKYYCIPAGSETTQVVDIVKRYLTNNPEKRHWPASFLVTNALSETYSCLKK